MTLFDVTHGVRAGWQRRAVAELARILDAHRDLPMITWTVGPAGATVVGRINAAAPALAVREAFDLWRAALALDEPTKIDFDGGAVHLRAVTNRNQVRLSLSATVVNDDGEG